MIKVLHPSETSDPWSNSCEKDNFGGVKIVLT